jgi:uncharacterized protein YkwD
MFVLVNRDRVAHQLPPLKYDERLADIARAHSNDMREHHFFDHVSSTFGDLASRMDRASYRNLVARENLAEAPDIAKAEENLLASPHHFENMMATDITHVGIGLVQGGVKDPRNLTITQAFARPAKDESAAQARSAVQLVINRERHERKLPGVTENRDLTQYAEEQLRSYVSTDEDPDVRTIGAVVSKLLSHKPIRGVRGISVSGQVMADSSQFQTPSALLRDAPQQYGVAVAEARPAGKRPVLKVLILVGL